MSDSDAIGRMPEQWSAAIAAIAQRRDKHAFAELFAHFAPRVKSFMRRSGLDENMAEELAQETLLRVWRKAEKFDPAAGNSAAWIFTIARNLRIDALRRARGDATQGASDIDGEYLRDDAPLPDAALAQMQTGEHVRRALATLPADQRQVIELSFYHEEAHGRIAELLGIPLGTVKSRLRLAAVKLRSVLEELT
jgi:RNA polymerase sigma-70 factor, ECF subfamily